MRIERHVVIRRPVEDVFALVGNPDNDPKWGSLVVESRCLSDGPIGPGTVFEQVGTLLGARMSAAVTVTAYDQDRRLCYRTENPVPIQHCRRLEQVPGGTDLVFSVDVELEGRFRLPSAMLSRLAERQVEADLESLRKLLESPDSGA